MTLEELLLKFIEFKAKTGSKITIDEYLDAYRAVKTATRKLQKDLG